jgi:cysteine-rich repeat protein
MPFLDCDEAPPGTPCGQPGSGRHCVNTACVKNSCGDGIVAEAEECDDANEREDDGCDNRCNESDADAGRDGGRDASADASADSGPDASGDAESSREAGADAALDTGTPPGPDTGPPPDSGHNHQPPDAGIDAAADAGRDAGADAGRDAGVDAGGDAGADAGGDAGDATVDAETEGGPPGPTCAQCEQQNCTEYLGVNVVRGCFESVDVDNGADPSVDPAFIQHCIDVVTCARANGCGFTAAFQALDCYCGSNSADCLQAGPASDAKCTAQWRAATRTEVHADVMMRLDQIMYPSGWAYQLLDCYRRFCDSAAVGNCTVTPQ